MCYKEPPELTGLEERSCGDPFRYCGIPMTDAAVGSERRSYHLRALMVDIRSSALAPLSAVLDGVSMPSWHRRVELDIMTNS